MQGVGYEIIVISTNILLYLRNDSYYGMRIGNLTGGFEWYHFQ